MAQPNLRLLDAPPSDEEELEPLTVDVPSDEVAPGVRMDGGAMHIEDEDGSVTIDFDPKPDIDDDANQGFYENLVNKVEGGKLAEIAASLIDGIDRDVASRQEWMDTRARGIQLLGLKLDEPRGDTGTDSAPLEGMSTVRHPLLLDATINFQATARGELLPAEGPVKVRNDTPPKLPSQSAQEATTPPQPSPPASGGPTGAAGPGGQPPAPAAPPQGFADGGIIQSAPQPPPPPAPPAPPPAAGAADFESKPVTTPSGSGNPQQDANPFATEIAQPSIEEKDTLAQALEMDFNHYLTTVAREYYPDTDRMLFYVGFGGDGFKKVYNCPLRRRPVSESVNAEDLIVSNSATDLSNCGRITHSIKMRKSIIRRMQILGAYADVDLTAPAVAGKSDPVQDEKNAIDGVNPLMQKPEDKDYTIYETYCELDLDEFAPSEFKGKGLPLPYCVTIEKDSRKVLAIKRNWKEDDEQALAKQFFVQFPFIRGLGFYGLGFVHLLGNTTNTLTAMWREMTDAGMFANFPGFLYAKGAGRQLTNQFRIPPGGGMGIEVPQMMRIQDAIMPVPYKEPGSSFTAFAQWVEQAGARLAQTGQIAVGEGKQDVPVGTTLALIEQATKILNSAHKRLHAAQSEEFALLAERFREDPEAFWRGNKKPALKWEKETFLRALDDYSIVPVADPNNPTSLHRAAKAQIIEGMAQKYSQVINTQAAIKRIFRVAGIDPEGLLFDQPLPPPPDPRMVAIQQKSQSTQQTVQAQTQAALAKAVAQTILGLKQVEQKQQDAASRTAIEQARLLLQAHETTSQVRNDRISHENELAADRARTMQELATERLKHQQQMDVERAKAAQEMQADAINRQSDLQNNMVDKAHDAFSGAHELNIASQKHQQELAQQRERHQQELAHERERMQLEREKHQAELAQQRAMARIKSPGGSKTTQKTTKSNAAGTKKTETTKTTED